LKTSGWYAGLDSSANVGAFWDGKELSIP